MTSPLTPKPRVPVVSSSTLATGLALAGAAVAMAIAGCDPIPPMHPSDGSIFPDAYAPPPMPPPMDAGEIPVDGPMPFPSDTPLVPMVDGSLEPVDAFVIAPMPPPEDAAVDPDTGVIAPMPPPMPPPMPDPPMPPPPMPAPKP